MQGQPRYCFSTARSDGPESVEVKKIFLRFGDAQAVPNRSRETVRRLRVTRNRGTDYVPRYRGADNATGRKPCTDQA